MVWEMMLKTCDSLKRAAKETPLLWSCTVWSFYWHSLQERHQKIGLKAWARKELTCDFIHSPAAALMRTGSAEGVDRPLLSHLLEGAVSRQVSSSVPYVSTENVSEPHIALSRG